MLENLNALYCVYSTTKWKKKADGETNKKKKTTKQQQKTIFFFKFWCVYKIVYYMMRMYKWKMV